MLSIRLSRVGKKHQPSYRLIVCDKRKDPWGNFLENLGFYNHLVKPKVVQFKNDRIKYWLSVGAQPTETVWNLLVDQKIVEGPKRKKHAAAKKKAEEKAEAKVKVDTAAKAEEPKEAEVKEENKVEDVPVTSSSQLSPTQGGGEIGQKGV